MRTLTIKSQLVKEEPAKEREQAERTVLQYNQDREMSQKSKVRRVFRKMKCSGEDKKHSMKA